MNKLSYVLVVMIGLSACGESHDSARIMKLKNHIYLKKLSEREKIFYIDYVLTICECHKKLDVDRLIELENEEIRTNEEYIAQLKTALSTFPLDSLAIYKLNEDVKAKKEQIDDEYDGLSKGAYDCDYATMDNLSEEDGRKMRDIVGKIPTDLEQTKSFVRLSCPRESALYEHGLVCDAKEKELRIEEFKLNRAAAGFGIKLPYVLDHSAF